MSKVSAHLSRDLLQYSEHLSVFLFGQQIDLQIKVIAFVAYSGIVILTDKDERRQKNRFQRNHQSKKSKGKGVNVFGCWQQVEDNPAAEPEHVDPNKGHAAAEIRDHFSRNKTASQIDGALRLLHEHGKAVMQTERTSGRPVERWKHL